MTGYFAPAPSTATLRVLRGQVAAAFSWLSADELDALEQRLGDVLGHYGYGARLRSGVSSKTNKPRGDLAILVKDCERSWKQCVRRQRQPRGLRGAHRQSPAEILARLVHQASTGKPMAASLARQAREARKILIDG
jgi:hypothetical protein